MLTLAAAAEACGVHKVTALKWIQRGKISATKNADGAWLVDPAELARAQLLKEQRNDSDNGQRLAAPDISATVALAVAEQRLADLKVLVEDLRSQRDAWQRQAEKLALPAPPARPWWKRLAG